MHRRGGIRHRNRKNISGFQRRLLADVALAENPGM
jgi:hypothetical protein